MGATNFSLITTATSLAGGTAGSNGQGGEFTFTVGGTWTNSDSITLTFTDLVTGLQTQIGAGNVSAIIPNYCFTFSKKVYVLSGPTTYFSEVNVPTSFNNPNGSGNGFVQMSNFYSNPESLVAIAPYQGRLVFFSRTTTQIWIVDANPLNWSLQQTLQNIGTFAPLSVQPLGDLDVMFLSDSGIRSLRARDNTLNAFVNDLGSPIDQLIQTSLENGTGNNIIPPGLTYNVNAYTVPTLPNTNYIFIAGLYEVRYQIGGASVVNVVPGQVVNFTTDNTGVFIIFTVFTHKPITGVVFLASTIGLSNALACAVVEPESGRYWCYLNGTIYVLSYYPNNKIIGWSTYLPTYDFVVAPFLTASVASTTEIDLTWTSAMGDLTVTYNLYRSIVSNFSPSSSSLIASSLTGNTYNDTGLTNNTTYYYFVVAVTSLGGNVISNEANGTTTNSGTGPSGSLVLTAVNDVPNASTQIDLSWTAATGSGITYSVYRSNNPSFIPGAGNLITSGLSGTTYNDTGINPGVYTFTPFYYYVVAINTYGTLTSNQANANTLQTLSWVSSQSSVFVGTPTDAVMQITWTQDPSVFTSGGRIIQVRYGGIYGAARTVVATPVSNYSPFTFGVVDNTSNGFNIMITNGPLGNLANPQVFTFNIATS